MRTGGEMNAEGTAADHDSRPNVDVLIDGLVFRADGFNDLIEQSELSALHVTAADFLAGYEVVLAQAAAWRQQCDDDPRLFHVAGPTDLERIGRTPGTTGIILGLQNGEPLERSLERLEELAALGVRVLQLTYNEANQLADGCLEPRDAGLTRLGRAVVAECNRLGIAVDLSHVGRRSSFEAAELSSVPVIATHVNRQALAPTPRNKADDELRAIADTGGVVGVSPYGVMCWEGNGRPTMQSFVEQVLTALEIVGEDALAIGTDHAAVAATQSVDGVLQRSVVMYPEIFSAYVDAFGPDLASRYCEGLESLACWPMIPKLLADAGLSAPVREKILAGNWLRVYRDIWIHDTSPRAIAR